MDLYILDGLLRRNQVVDNYESLVWTERWREIGDFELDLKSTLENRSRFLTGTKLAINNSHRVMTVESVEDETGDDGKEILKVKGRSLEALLEDRVAKESLDSLALSPSWVIIDTPGNVARAMFDHVCRDTALSPYDAIPFLQPGTIFPEDTIQELETPIKWEQKPDSLYNAIKAVCTSYDLGFRMVRNFDTSQLYFDIYAGHDRTTRQTLHNSVVFDMKLDNIQNTKEFSSVQKSKNVAYVFSEYGSVVVYGDHVDPDIDGFDRRVIAVRAQVDSQEEGATIENTPDIHTSLVQQGEKALLDNRAKALFDGEVDQRTEFTYGVDYELGDLVEMRNKDGIVTYKRVSEQIFVADAAGERAYPTLSLDVFAGENTWLAWTNKNKVWEEFEEETWEDM